MKNPEALYTVVDSSKNAIIAGVLTFDEAKHEFFRMHESFPNRQLIGWPGGSMNDAQSRVSDPTYKRNVIISAESGKGFFYNA